jgi:hypothetical protein
MKKHYIITFFVLLSTVGVSAQTVELNGEVDFEIRKGGENSSFITNEIPNEYRNAQLTINQFNLFLFSQLAETWSFNGRFQMDTWGTGRLNQPRITLAALTWQPSTRFSANLGRFISPFGLYARRQLLSQQLFASVPLTYGYFTKVTETFGFWPAAGTTGVYGTDDVGMTTLYFAAYNTGASMNLILIPNRVNLEVAVTNVALSAQREYTNLATVAGVARLGVKPAMWWEQGFSASYGSYMSASDFNFAVREEGNALERFRQLVVGTDFVISYSYFELSGEAVFSQWTAPKYTAATGFFREPNSTTLQTLTLQNISGYADLKFEPPFLTGWYLAFRAERMSFEPTDDIILRNNAPVTIKRSWSPGITRLSGAVGYKLTKAASVRLTYADQRLDGLGDRSPQQYAARALLIIQF